MSICLITGSGGLIGSEAVKFFSDKFDKIIGIDNNFRAKFFGPDASVLNNVNELRFNYKNYFHVFQDFRNYPLPKNIDLIIHCASQPSHDWAAKNPVEDFQVNAAGTIVLLEKIRQKSPNAVFIFMSSNKVYGDEINNRYYISRKKRYKNIISDIDLNIDKTMHSIYGASKLAADIFVQEYGLYYGMKTVCFRAGCISGPGHTGVEAHGFLSYLMKCAISEKEYKIYGFKGKQVRDNLHSKDLVNAFWEFYNNPQIGAVYDIGGGKFSNCSILEAIEMCEEITGKKMKYSFIDQPRKGDHKWWISDLEPFMQDYPEWKVNYTIRDILKQIYDKHNISTRIES